MSKSSLASRLYRGEAGIEVIGRRKMWFGVAVALVVLAVASFAIRGFSLGIEFKGGNEFQLPASVGTLQQTETVVGEVLAGQTSDDGEPARVVSAQQVGGNTYLLRTSPLDQEQVTEVTEDLAQRFNISTEEISSSRVSAAWGAQVTNRAMLGLLIFVLLVTVYLVLRFEWRMAVAAVFSLVLDLLLTAGVYSLVGFEVTPSTIIGFLTILGFALYDVVVVFDKIQENTRGITANSTRTYAEASNLAINQTLMRSINTSVVALLPVGGLLFIGAGLLGAGTLKDLGLVLFVGMGLAFFSSIFLATPFMVTLKEQEPRIKSHTQRVLARRAGGGAPSRSGRAPADQGRADGGEPEAGAEAAALVGTAPKVGARPTGKRAAGGNRGGRPGTANRPGGGKRR